MFDYITWPFLGSIATSIIGNFSDQSNYNKKSNKFFNIGFYIGFTFGVVRAYTGKPLIKYFLN